MKSTAKNLCWLIPAIILLSCIIISPVVWVTISDRHLYADSHPLSKVDFSLSSEISDIPLIYRIHKLLGSYYGENQDTDTGESESIVLMAEEQVDVAVSFVTATEFEELTQYENLNRILKTIIGDNEIQCTVVHSSDDQDSNMTNVVLLYNKKIEVQYIYDMESEKILRLSLPRAEGEQLNAEVKKKAMEEFIAYLNLDILEDWYHNGESMISNKAHLALSFQETEEQWILGFSII